MLAAMMTHDVNFINCCCCFLRPAQIEQIETMIFKCCVLVSKDTPCVNIVKNKHYVDTLSSFSECDGCSHWNTWLLSSTSKQNKNQVHKLLEVRNKPSQHFSSNNQKASLTVTMCRWHGPPEMSVGMKIPISQLFVGAKCHFCPHRKLRWIIVVFWQKSKQLWKVVEWRHTRIIDCEKSNPWSQCVMSHGTQMLTSHPLHFQSSLEKACLFGKGLIS